MGFAVEIGDIFVGIGELGGLDGGSLMANEDSGAAALGNEGFADVVHGVDVDVGERGDDAVRPVIVHLADGATGEEFISTVGAVVDEGVGLETFLEPPVESEILMGGRDFVGVGEL